jgi:methylated-DNA-[protein]-cysteine S-methyltransferase
MPAETRHFYRSPTGLMMLRFEEETLVGVDFDDDNPSAPPCPELPDGVHRRWLDDYFAGRDPGALPPHRMGGSAFQQRVWREMLAIPRGQTLSYGQVAMRIGSAPRAVGQACRRNHLPVFIPCHRIVAASSAGGYAGATGGHKLDRKLWLLRHEGAVV